MENRSTGFDMMEEHHDSYASLNDASQLEIENGMDENICSNCHGNFHDTSSLLILKMSLVNFLILLMKILMDKMTLIVVTNLLM